MDKTKAGQYRAGSAKPAQNGRAIKTFDGLNTEQIASTFSRYEGQIGQLVSKAIRDRFVQIAITMVAQDRTIKQCTQESVLGAFLSAAMYDLEILPQFGHCYFVPYKNKYKDNMKELQFQIGYQGYVVLMERGGAKDVFAKVVRENDRFDVDWARDIPIIHKPNLDAAEDSPLKYVWGRIINSNDIKKFDYMNQAAVYKRRDSSPAYRQALRNKKDLEDSIWVKWEDDMWMKTLIRNMRKQTTLSTRREETDLTLADGAVIPAHLLTGPKKIDLSKITYPDHEDTTGTGGSVILDESTSQEHPEPGEAERSQEDQPTVDPEYENPELRPIEPKHLKFIMDSMKKAKIEDYLKYVANWGVKELSVNAINVETAKGILMDLGLILNPKDPGEMIDVCFHVVTDQQNDKKSDSKKEEKEPEVDQQKTASNGDQQEEPPPETDTKKEPETEKVDQQYEPVYNTNDIRSLFKQKTQALSEEGIYTIGDLIARFDVKTLTNTNCTYEKYIEMKNFLEDLPNNQLKQEGDK